MSNIPPKKLLTLENWIVCSAFIGMGVEKLRITGGEPLVRRGIMNFFKSMTRHLESGALKELTLTTNGSQLEKYALGCTRLGSGRLIFRWIRWMSKILADITKMGAVASGLAGDRCSPKRRSSCKN